MAGIGIPQLIDLLFDLISLLNKTRPITFYLVRVGASLCCVASIRKKTQMIYKILPRLHAAVKAKLL